MTAIAAERGAKNPRPRGEEAEAAETRNRAAKLARRVREGKAEALARASVTRGARRGHWPAKGDKTLEATGARW